MADKSKNLKEIKSEIVILKKDPYASEKKQVEQGSVR